MPKYVKHPIKGYENLYWITKDGRVFNAVKELKQFKHPQGYMKVGLTKNKKNKIWAVHRLVAITFIPNPENKPQVNHMNSIRHDNHLTNLEWCTSAENIAHAVIANRKRKDQQNKDILKMLEKGHKKYMREHPEEFDERGLRINGPLGRGFRSLVPVSFSSEKLLVVEPNNQTGLGRGFGRLIPYNFDDSQIKVK